MGQGQELRAGDQLFELFQVGRAGLHRALSVRPQHRARRRPLPPRLQQLQLRRQRAQHDLRADQHRRPDPRRRAAHRDSCRSRCATASTTTRSASTRTIYFTDPDGAGPLPAACDPLRRRPLSVRRDRQPADLVARLFAGLDTLNNRLRPTRGQRFVLSQDFAGLGGDVRYLRTRLNAAKYWNVWRQLHLLDPGRGRLHPQLRGRRGPDVDPVRLTDRFFLGNPQIRGFDIRGVGPRIQRALSVRSGRRRHDQNVSLDDDPQTITDDAIGGRAYYVGRAELEIPLGASVRELGLRPSVFVDVGALFGRSAARPARHPARQRAAPSNACTDDTAGVVDDPARQRQLCTTGETLTRGAAPVPRALPRRHAEPAPLGRLRRQLELALRPVPDRYRQGARSSEPGDDTKLFSFNVGTAF